MGSAWAEAVETHTAAIFLAGDRVYKVKKPVKLDFVDFSTLQARRAACVAEVALNRRLSPDVYLGVANIEVSEQAIEHAVVMRRLPAATALAARVRVGAPNLRQQVREIADRLAAFHRQCPVVGGDLPRDLWTDPVESWRTEAARIQSLLQDGSCQNRLRRATTLAESYALGRTELFTRRLDLGMVRDGHGDLLAEDVYLLADGPRLLDCLEFDTRLRVCDVLHDAAFLAMDLDHLGRADLAHVFIERYKSQSGDDGPASLIHFFMAHRALIRAKVAAIRAGQTGSGPEPEVAALLALTLKHIQSAQVRLVMLGGLPGSGKTAIATALAEQLPAIHLSSDRIRAELIESSTTFEAFGTGRYAPTVTDRVYREMLRRADEALRAGEHVLLDASWSSDGRRRTARRTAADTNAVAVELLIEADDPTAAERIGHRPRLAGGSEASEQVRTHMRDVFDAWPQATTVRNGGRLCRAVATTARVIKRATPAEANI